MKRLHRLFSDSSLFYFNNLIKTLLVDLKSLLIMVYLQAVCMAWGEAPIYAKTVILRFTYF